MPETTVNKPKRSDSKYWTGTRQFDHLAYESDLEDYISELEENECISTHCTSCGKSGCNGHCD